LLYYFIVGTILLYNQSAGFKKNSDKPSLIKFSNMKQYLVQSHLNAHSCCNSSVQTYTWFDRIDRRVNTSLESSILRTWYHNLWFNIKTTDTYQNSQNRLISDMVWLSHKFNELIFGSYCRYLRFLALSQNPICYGVHKKETCGIESIIHTF